MCLNHCFNCCLSVVLSLDKGAYPENVDVVCLKNFFNIIFSLSCVWIPTVSFVPTII